MSVIWRIGAAILAIWLLGFAWFAFSLPRPVEGGATDAVVVPTGGAGRIARGLDIIGQGYSPRLFISGVDSEVRPKEFANEFAVEPEIMECCVALGYSAFDTRGNANEAADWLEENDVASVRLVTSDWHMRRAAGEFRAVLPQGVSILEDAVTAHPPLPTLFLEYNKWLISGAARWIFE